MPQFRKKPVVVEATQFFPERKPWPTGVRQRTSSVCSDPQCGDSTWDHDCDLGSPIDEWEVITIHRQAAQVVSGDWIITEPDGEHHYPCKPDIFKASYVEVANAPHKLDAEGLLAMYIDALNEAKPPGHRTMFVDEQSRSDALRFAEAFLRRLGSPPIRTWDQRAADALADEVDVLVRRKAIDSRSPAADALLGYRNPPMTERSDRLVKLEAIPRCADCEANLEYIVRMAIGTVRIDDKTAVCFPCWHRRYPKVPELPVFEFEYTNHRGKNSRRRVIPERVLFNQTWWHPEPQWLLDAWDVDKNARCTFAMKDIHA